LCRRCVAVWLAIVGKRTFQGTQALTRSPAEKPSPRKDERLVLAEAERGCELGALPFGFDPALVAHLPAAVGIEGGLPELGEEGTVAEILDGADLREHLGLLPADELRLEAGLSREVPLRAAARSFPLPPVRSRGAPP
jgi:hypothetical protein